MAVSSFSRRASARPPNPHFKAALPLRDAVAAMWASVMPWLPTRAGFWAMTVGQPLVLARVCQDSPRRFRSAAD